DQVMPTGVRAVGALLQARLLRHHPDGLSELDAGGLSLFLPKVPQAPGSLLRVRILAQDVILSRQRPEGLSALNIMPGVVEQVRSGSGPGAMVSLKTDAGRVLARITRRSAQALELSSGTPCYAVVKSVAIARSDVGGAVPVGD
ncbi:TOBE domain-containing protein, partial [uncultured Lentibacter sp.]|uniref:TOBE domain-containing protein n=1 Tax=uncultured Lentibacter sp. TaxID=1659309 RepID=UPI002615C7EA